MITIPTKQLEKEFVSQDWDLRVKRPGYLQSRAIVSQAELQPLNISRSVVLKYNSIFWVNDANLYDNAATKNFYDKFIAAFKQDKKWPLKLVQQIDKAAGEAHSFCKYLKHKNWSQATVTEKLTTLKKYKTLLLRIQKYYIVAVPLTNYCEKELQLKNPTLLAGARSYKVLDVDRLHLSLISIKSNSGSKQKEMIRNHVKKYGWIKTAYNIIDNYTEKDVREEIKNISSKKLSGHPHVGNNYILVGLQAGIYLRNRMKEISQQIWFSFEPLAQQLAADLNIKREDFFQMRDEEVVQSLRNNNILVAKRDVKNRHQGYAHGYLNNREILWTGPIVKKLYSHVTKPDKINKNGLEGQVACRGLVQGEAKIILRQAEFNKLKPGDILVTNMTTPDYTVIMKKAGGIVTDEGGLSCHAAIVSRELNIPCIIGTKIATKSLKDGELVEVDANMGIVRKLKSKGKK
ncbi:MAG: hypothetical protein A3J07_03735 [Candidatus Doudnabacteria bacterium RIFCSPLOWO2_02_FULL_49_13]|uniref:PEP-utilising enzyme mobile domain-containing protein n=1 Tax=Candidatus Doudnabacteria bacterium RIFCSPHIGHO2_12_FULL_48_16 TaxID=1817838 RepID=A0A1F5PJJ9_9BACT|nr:MAG: hypothetical protein A3B77_02545 [Candidatus Doudnabacteria bacterium RIFCSPHIGHO2_02_FULL_49_24]OGE89586.1 MAG: hypothetical protein A2760_03750 [Candidatus Doudnabacteria bacterium RIFCSPHIGHO2_01_FULL_50_67]OGE90029.1 MAG: hypothetical protein A3E29_02880 [Candidatus Doudnabacteria bacterium RIFCSPHIGHO2_12_FULL_48_16]OGE96602.1 MAG: hypothetical protein A2990_00190 [Candidatus Doudnabacteria bacterium RIFCSPLOWO2_01_FULL_49_40]OGF03172.1 MAG: hypothetical protein A3J07_03735 [Candid